MRSTSIFACLCFAALVPGCVWFSGDILPLTGGPRSLTEHTVAGEGDDKILILDVSRLISNESDQGVFGFGGQESVVSRVEAELQQAARDEDIRGVIVRINSPGGTVTASDILFERIRKFRTERKVPVVAQLMDVAASGGYYTALAADEIQAHPTTITGSIGVIFQGLNFEGLMEKVGVANQTIKSGAKKDIGSPFRQMSDDERALLEQVLMEMRDQFVHLVRERRPTTTDAEEKVFGDGRIVTARQALELKLIDRIGTLDDAIARVQKLAGLKEARVVIYRRPGEPSETVYAMLDACAQQGGGGRSEFNFIQVNADAALEAPRFLYLWAP